MVWCGVVWYGRVCSWIMIDALMMLLLLLCARACGGFACISCIITARLDHSRQSNDRQ